MSRAGASPKLKTNPPVNLFLKPLTVDYKAMFKAIAKGLAHASILKWEELGNDTVEALSSLGLATDPGELAYLLVKRSLIQALFDLLQDSATQLLAEATQGEEEIVSALETSLIEQQIDIDARFIDRPLDLAIVKATQQNIELWLSKHPHLEATADVIAQRFPSYFAYALNKEWRKNAKAYQPVIEALDTPFTKAGEREWAWSAYSALLDKRVQEPSFDEAFSLRQIFIHPNAYFSQRPIAKSFTEGLKRGEDSGKRIVVSLKHELGQWLSASNPDDAIRVISGGPGSGKSSFSRVFASEIAATGKVKVLFIPLHLIDPLKDLCEEVGRFVKEEGILNQNPLDADSPEPNLLLIFDGLDELASQGKAAAEASRSFIREVEKTVQMRNLVATKLRVIISGRELVIQENEGDFRRDRQVLNIMPYFIAAEDLNAYSDSSNLLSIDLRDEWWKNYSSLTGKSYIDLPRELKRPDLVEITAQPLLNYLVALSYTRGKINFHEDVHLNAIYADLVAAVYHRGYEKHRTFGPIRHMASADFARVLEEIGLAAWHGDGRTTSVAEIEQHCRLSGLGHLLDLFQDGATAGVTRLLAAFFFRQHGQRSGGDATFVFTHKSFGEYLAARRIARAVERIAKEMERRSKSPDEGYDERDALRYWTQICGPTAMSTYIHRFLRSELASGDQQDLYQKHLQSVFSQVLRQGTPIEQLRTLSLKLLLSNVRNSEEALLVVLNACAMKTKKISKLTMPDRTAFGSWFRRIQGQRPGPQSVLAASCLSYLDLSDVCLDIGDFYQANFSFSILRGVAAHYANFAYTNFHGADLTGAALSWAILEGANFSSANLENATLADANIKGIDVESTNLMGAKIGGAICDRGARPIYVKRGAISER